MNEETDILLSRYFSGEASEQELRLLDEWLSESAENEAYFEEMTTIFQHSSPAKLPFEPDTEKAFSKFKQHIEKSENTTQKTVFRKLIPYISVAASIALIIGISVSLFQKPDKHIYLTANETALEQILFEGVNIVLEPGAQIKYNPEKKNEITLSEGKATFTVNSSQSGKLLVQVGETFIEDIGTTFRIIADNPEKSVIVEVAEGEVLFYTKENPGIHVKQSEKGIYHTKENYFKHISLIENIKAIEFDATPLAEVIEILSVQYKTKIKTNSDSLNDLQISVSFDPNEKIEDILAIISETLSVHVIKESDGAYIFSH